MEIAILIFDRLTALDAIGPYDRKIGVKRKCFVLGPFQPDGFTNVTSADILVIPGGIGEEAVRSKPEMIEWVRAIHATTRWTTSVCTGALILGAAGILRGLDATTHWSARELLRGFGAVPVKERVVERGKVITAAGVSAGIDMALHLVRRVAGDEIAQAIQIGIEYDPQPPFDGVFERAPVPIAAYLRKVYAHRLGAASR